MKLLIAIPAMDFMSTMFVESLIKLTQKLTRDGTPYEVEIKSGTLVYLAREHIVSKAINEDNGFTHVLWLDSDMVFTPDLVDDLMFSGKDFVTGIYHGRRKPFLSVIFSQISPTVKRFEEYPKSAFKIAACGFGCVLIKTEILRYVRRSFHTCFTPLPSLGEDIAFCDRCVKLGIDIWAEPAVRLGHVGHIAVYPGDEHRWMTEISNLDDFN